MEPFEQKDVKKYRTQVVQTIYHFSINDTTIIIILFFFIFFYLP